MKRSLLFLLFAALASAAEPQHRFFPPLTFRSGHQRIVIPQRNAEGPHDFRGDSCAGFILTSTLHAAIRRGDILYVVYGCAGWSRGPYARGGRCGSGWEHQINWVAVRGGIVIDHQRQDLESCWQDAVGGGIVGWRGAKLHWVAGEREGEYTCCFDSSFPEGGLQVLGFEERQNL